MLYFEKSGTTLSLSDDDIKSGLYSALDKLKKTRSLTKVIALPPDITRFHSRAGAITVMADEYFGDALTDIMPALGTHYPMAESEIEKMFPGIEPSKFREHNWRTDVVTLGNVPSDFVKDVSGGAVDYDWPAQVNRLLVEREWDLILSIGQVVPHEVIGFANHNKNIFVGTGGAEAIHKSHFLGAAFGMERIMGKADTPVRQVLNYADKHFASELPVLYVQTVISPDPDGSLHVRGLFIGDGYECYQKAAELSLHVNFIKVDKPFKKAVVFLEPEEFRSTWLGNKSIYRTRMAMADDSQLIVIAPGLKEFGEDSEIDRLIRKYGYHGTERVLSDVASNAELQDNLSAAAHLIHGSSEGRFSITYASGFLGRGEIEAAGYNYLEIGNVLQMLGIEGEPSEMKNGFYKDRDGEDFYFIRNPALGLWAYME